jgi:hypothetical protein
MTSERAPLRAARAVGLVAGSTLALQVLLTGIFSALLFYHLAFFAISLALLGAGAGGVLVLGSVLAIFVAINWGFAVARLVAAAYYAAAAAHARLGRWP